MGTVCFWNDHFAAITGYGDYDLVDRLPKFKYDKDHLCSACEQGKSKKASFPPKLVPSTESKLELLHMDLCGPMRVESINGKKYILVIIDDYSRYTWAQILKIQTDNGIDFKNEKLRSFYSKLGIIHNTSISRTPQQNSIVERRNRTLIKATRTMLIFSKTPEFLWAKAIATACFTQNRSIVHTRYNKTHYELIRGRKPKVQCFYVFGSLCYPTNDRDDLGKMKPKADVGIVIGYSESSRGFRIYNHRTKKIMETIHVKFDELTTMASKCNNSGPGFNYMNFQDSSEDIQLVPSKTYLDNLFGPLYKEYYVTKDKAFQIVSLPKEPVDTEPNTPVLNENVDELVQEDVHQSPEKFHYVSQNIPWIFYNTARGCEKCDSISNANGYTVKLDARDFPHWEGSSQRKQLRKDTDESNNFMQSRYSNTLYKHTTKLCFYE
ncbi:retrovirus-related pol polyprotein from transposon TNT 1-94 [Tanacetum coccineum]